ncbi:hypothetical protein FOZ63_012268 [Perkinsus olseni]|uniref:Uncharacterized protein n=1 Tax=Perkinsus olseni TaxID=32597 RepID=A0A7J6SE68_PEROL|nr:hypothetical protein FOZ63_012268 [Perkinsus olseni]
MIELEAPALKRSCVWPRRREQSLRWWLKVESDMDWRDWVTNEAARTGQRSWPQDEHVHLRVYGRVLLEELAREKGLVSFGILSPLARALVDNGRQGVGEVEWEL